jgi:hypothetical protein
MITNDARSRIAMTKAAFTKKTLFTIKLDFKFKEEISEVLH